MKLNELLMVVPQDPRCEDIIIKMLKAAFNRVDVLEAQISEYQKQIDEYNEVLNIIRKKTTRRYSDVCHGDVLDFHTIYSDDEGFDLIKKYLAGDEEEKEEE